MFNEHKDEKLLSELFERLQNTDIKDGFVTVKVVESLFKKGDRVRYIVPPELVGKVKGGAEGEAVSDPYIEDDLEMIKIKHDGATEPVTVLVKDIEIAPHVELPLQTAVESKVNEVTNPANYILYRWKNADGETGYGWISKRDTGNQGSGSKEYMAELFGPDFEKQVVDKSYEEVRSIWMTPSNRPHRADDMAEAKASEMRVVNKLFELFGGMNEENFADMSDADKKDWTVKYVDTIIRGQTYPMKVWQYNVLANVLHVSDDISKLDTYKKEAQENKHTLCGYLLDKEGYSFVVVDEIPQDFAGDLLPLATAFAREKVNVFAVIDLKNKKLLEGKRLVWNEQKALDRWCEARKDIRTSGSKMLLEQKMEDVVKHFSQKYGFTAKEIEEALREVKCRYCGRPSEDKSGVCDACYKKYEQDEAKKDKPEVFFGDPMMQQQFEDLLKRMTPEQAKAAVKKAHKEYFGDAAKFYGVEEKKVHEQAPMPSGEMGAPDGGIALPPDIPQAVDAQAALDKQTNQSQPVEDKKFMPTEETAQEIAKTLGISFDDIKLDQFMMGLEVEQEHIDVTDGDPIITGKIALAHLKEMPDYYTRLKQMEEDAKKQPAEVQVGQAPAEQGNAPIGPELVGVAPIIPNESKVTESGEYRGYTFTREDGVYKITDPQTGKMVASTPSSDKIHDIIDKLDHKGGAGPMGEHVRSNEKMTAEEIKDPENIVDKKLTPKQAEEIWQTIMGKKSEPLVFVKARRKESVCEVKAELQVATSEPQKIVKAILDAEIAQTKKDLESNDALGLDQYAFHPGEDTKIYVDDMLYDIFKDGGVYTEAGMAFTGLYKKITDALHNAGYYLEYDGQGVWTFVKEAVEHKKDVRRAGFFLKEGLDGNKYATCGFCGLEMSPDNKGCWPYLKDSTGKYYKRIAYGDEGEGTEMPCGDCNVRGGGYHHDGCDNETCPKCNGQMLGCGCDWTHVLKALPPATTIENESKVVETKINEDEASVLKEVEAIYNEIKDKETADTSSPAAPDTSKFKASHSGKIDLQQGGTATSPGYSRSQIPIIAGIKVGGAVPRQVHDYVDSKMRAIAQQNKAQVMVLSGTNWSMYSIYIPREPVISKSYKGHVGPDRATKESKVNEQQPAKMDVVAADVPDEAEAKKIQQGKPGSVISQDPKTKRYRVEIPVKEAVAVSKVGEFPVPVMELGMEVFKTAELTPDQQEEIFDLLDKKDPRVVKAVRKMVDAYLKEEGAKDVKEVGIAFKETDSGNISHAGAYFDVELEGPAEEIAKVVGINKLIFSSDE